MNRRDFIGAVGGLPLVVEAQSQAAQKAHRVVPHAPALQPPVESPVEQMIAARSNLVILCHLGFKLRGKKVLVVRWDAEPTPTEYQLTALDHRPVQFTRPLTRVHSDFGTFLTADFSDLDQLGLYQITVGSHTVNGERFGGALSAPFLVDDRVWRRTIPKAVSYIHFQRCGVEVPGCHDACHMDDGRRGDNGQHVDATGGWHDAGDFWKPADYNGLMATAMVRIQQNLPDVRPGDCTPDEILDEVRHGNHYFMNLQDTDGRVWAGCGGNWYTDNVIGTPDDRPVITSKPGRATAVFVMLQSLIAQRWRKSDPRLAAGCLGAGVKAWKTVGRPTATLDLAFWVVAGCELYRATRDPAHRQKTIELGQQLLYRQNTSFIQNQRMIRGYWMMNDGRPFVQQNPEGRTVDSSMPSLAMIELYETFPDIPNRSAWRDAVQMYLDEYVVPLSERNVFGLIPVGLYFGSPTPETYRPLAGNLTYRYFMPVRKSSWWLGTTSHLLSMALMLGRFARLTGGKGRSYVDLAYRQMEWVLGANPFGASLMMGVGLHNPMPFSMFNGLIPGGILNGVAGNRGDEPILNQTNAMDWRTCEYWSPHAAYYIWANSVLETVA